MAATRSQLRWAAVAALVLVALVLSVIAWTPGGRAVYNTALFVTQVVPNVPSVTAFQPEPTRERLTIETPEGEREADLYRPPGDGPYAAVVLFLGVAPAGPDDPRVVNLGHALARSGFVTLLYWSPEKLVEERLHPPDVRNLVAAYQYLQGLPMVDRERVGLAGFCVGASFALMAAAQPEVRQEVAFVNAFGPYNDLLSLLYAYGTRSRQTDEGREPWRIDPLTERVTTTMLLDTLSPDDREIVQEALGGQDLPADLSTEAQAVHRILAGGASDQVEEALGFLPSEVVDLFREASPSQYVEQVEAPVLLMHDRADDLVPAWESRVLYERMRETGGDVRYTEFTIFEHMDPTRDLPLTDLVSELWKLSVHLYTVMRQAV